LKTVQNLTFINLSDNLDLILELSTFESHEDLKTLSLNNVTLARYDFYDILIPLKNLTSLSIGKNNLTHIDIVKLGFLENIESLTIDMNNLTSFDYEYFLKVFRKIKKVKIGGNELSKHNNKIFVFEIGASVLPRNGKNCLNVCKIPPSTEPISSLYYSAIYFSFGAVLTLIIMIFVVSKIYFQRKELERFQKGVSFNLNDL
jgi:hypothetical protein